MNEFCVICDERHILETGLLRVIIIILIIILIIDIVLFLSLSSQPCVCTRELCVFAFQTLGVMADAAESVATDASVST